MLDLAEIPFFDSLSEDTLAELRNAIPTRLYSQGSVIVRAGDQGRHFHAIADGAVWVQQSDGANRQNRGLFLGPGQVFGEMSLFAGAPVSATLTATKDTTTYCLDGEEFLALLDQEPSLHIKLTKMLIERLRRQTRSEGPYPGLIILAYDEASSYCRRFAEILVGAVTYYSPGAITGVDGTTAGVESDVRHLAAKIVRWRDEAPRGQHLILRIPPLTLCELTSVLEHKDVVLHISDLTRSPIPPTSISNQAAVADFSRAYIGQRPSRDLNPWAYCVPTDEINSVDPCQPPSGWQSMAAPSLDAIARYLTSKEVGIAMSSGAARGFAHLGVLEVLEEHGVPFDTLCGSSMGGIVALTVARKASVAEALAQVRELLGANRKVRDPSLLPRGSLFAGRKVAAAAKTTFGDCTFGDLRIPAAVVAADLVGSERVIVNRGPVAPAILATSAIPGFYPPVPAKKRLLVDGGVVARVPVDVLDNRRCGIRIAINVLNLSHRATHDIFTGVDGQQNSLLKPFGIMAVLGTSWELLGSWGSSNEVLGADVVISPQTPHRSGYDFDKFEAIAESGREAAKERIEAIVTMIENMKRL